MFAKIGLDKPMHAIEHHLSLFEQKILLV